MKRLAVGLALAATAGAVGAQQPAQTVQQQFEAATALERGTDAVASLAAWEALERRVAGNRRSRALVLVRKSNALLKLGRLDEAAASARAGLADLPAADATLRDDRWTAYNTIGHIAANGLDYSSAAVALSAALMLSTTLEDRLSVGLDLVEVQTFVDPDGAMATLAMVEGIAKTNPPAAAVQARLAAAKGVLLMNRGDKAGARAATEAAVRLSGGLTTRVSLQDVSIRSDAAIAALLDGREDQARQYMAMTGAGRMGGDTTFDRGIAMVPPDCGGEAGLKPDDVAVVEFSIGEDGAVILSTPIYAAGGGRVALEFARSVKNWSWRPEQVKALKPFFRYNARVELRCNKAFERPSIGGELDLATAAWLDAKRVEPAPEVPASPALAVKAYRAALAAREAQGGANSLGVVPILVALMASPLVDAQETGQLAARALAIVAPLSPPPLVRLKFDLATRTAALVDQSGNGKTRGVLDAMIADPVYAADPSARAALRLMVVDRQERGGEAAARVILRQVADDAALPAAAPLKVGALIRLASLEQQAGDTAAAQAAFKQSGLVASQCALLDDAPRFLHAGNGPNAFPTEALSWRFEGWTRVQFDVDAAGKVVNQRAIVSYPPFVFTRAGNRVIGTAAFAKSYRPDGGLGCGARTQDVKFLLPG